MRKTNVHLISFTIFIVLLIGFTIYHATHFQEYSPRKGDEYFCYLGVVTSIAFSFYLVLLLFKKINIFQLVYYPFLSLAFSLMFTILFSLVFATDNLGFYTFTCTLVLITFFILQLLNKRNRLN